MLLSRLAVAATLLASAAAPLRAQADSDWTAPGWVGDATFLSLNALSGGLTAGLFQTMRGESFTDGFARGALGGAVYYAGLRTSTRRFDGAGLVGRQIAATGTSMVRNASDGVPLLERLFVPLGPLHLYIDHSDGLVMRPKVNVTALTGLLSAVAEPKLKWDAGATLSAGAPVFRVSDRMLVSDGRVLNGFVRAGSIFLSDIPPEHRARVFAHERAHVLQGDLIFLAWSEPLEGWIMGRVPRGPLMYRYADLGFAVPWLMSAAYDLLDVAQGDRFHEIEAHFLDDR